MYKLKDDLKKHSYKNINIREERVLLRTCLNVSTDDEGKIIDATRLNEAMPLIRELALTAPSLVIMGHLGRPVAGNRERKFSFRNIAEAMQRELVSEGVSVHLIENLDDKLVEKIQNNENSGAKREIFLLENVRFFEGEESKNKDERLAFAKQLARLGDYFINDAFADYKASASTYDIATILPGYLGPLFMREVEALSRFDNPKKPFIAVLGGAKLSEKLDALNSIVTFADKVIIGGAMAYTLLKAKGISVGNSLVENDKIDVALEIMNKHGKKLLLPIDHLVADEFSEEASKAATFTEEQSIQEGKIAIDIGPESINLFKKEVAEANSILWNGPMGVYEWDKSVTGTKSIADSILENKKAFSLIGGGDTLTVVNKFNMKGFNSISTGGGAMLAYLSYDKFPTLDVIVGE